MIGRVLAICASFHPREDSEALVTTRLVRGLREAGCLVDVISQRGGDRDLSENRNASTRRPRYELSYPRVRQFVRTVIGARNCQTARYRFESRWARRAGSEIASGNRNYDIVLSFGGYCHLAALQCAPAWDAPIIAVWNDPFPSLIAPPPYGHGLEERLPLVYRRFLGRIGARAAWHVFPSKHLRSYMLSTLPAAVASRSSVIPHMAGRAWTSSDAAVGRGHMVITHAGGLLPNRKVGALFDGAHRWTIANPESSIRFRFIGPQRELLLDEAQKYGCAAICDFVPEVSNTRCRELLGESDVLLVVEAQTPQGIFLPTKFVDYAETCRPILALTPTDGTVSDYLRGYGGGIAVDGASPEQVASALSVLHGAWRKGLLFTSFSSSRLSPLFCQETIVRAYQDIFQTVLKDCKNEVSLV
ncbi:MAG: glycosyltransferase [Acidobacteriia bacterium]|nr:glycosyltransferase [Terriglobia bacterium]